MPVSIEMAARNEDTLDNMLAISKVLEADCVRKDEHAEDLFSWILKQICGIFHHLVSIIHAVDSLQLCE